MSNNDISAEAIKKKARLPKNKRFYWIFFVLSASFLLLGVALLPLWRETNVFWKSWGSDFFNFILFGIIFVYIAGYLIRQMLREKKLTIKVLTIFEAGFFFAIAIGCIMEQFTDVSVTGPCTIVGAALWSRGFVYIVKAYLCKHDESDKYPLWMLIVSVGLVTLGSVMMVKPIFDDELVVWIVAVALLLAALVFFIFGFISKPKPDKAAKKIAKLEKAEAKAAKTVAKLEKSKAKAAKNVAKLEKAEAKAAKKAAKLGNSKAKAESDAEQISEGEGAVIDEEPKLLNASGEQSEE